jgi:hypothetical protein
MAQGFATNGNIVISGQVDNSNSSTTPLTSGSTFTGSWVDVSSYSSMVVTAKTDQNGVYTIEFSPDGVNADSTLLRYYRTNQIEPPHRFTITRKYMRVKFQNSSVGNQTYLRLQTILGSQGDLNVPTDSTMSQDYDAISVRPTDYRYEVALTRRQGSTNWNKYGFNSDVDVGTEVLWSYGGLHTILTSASTLSVVSSSANDTAAGTGARQITITGVDGNNDTLVENVTLNGVTPVVTSGTFLGVNRVQVISSGSGTVNAGDITITASTGGSVQAYLATGTSITQQCIFFTQAEHISLCDWLQLNCVKISGGGGSPVVTFKAWLYLYDSNTKYEILRQTIDTTVENTIQLVPSQPLIIPAKSVFWIEVTTDINNTSASGRFSLIEVRNINAE